MESQKKESNAFDVAFAKGSEIAIACSIKAEQLSKMFVKIYNITNTAKGL